MKILVVFYITIFLRQVEGLGMPTGVHESCQSIYNQDNRYHSGSYVIYHNNQPIDVYCSFEKNYGYTYISRTSYSDSIDLSKLVSTTSFVKLRLRHENGRQSEITVSYPDSRPLSLYVGLNTSVEYEEPYNKDVGPYLYLGILQKNNTSFENSCEIGSSNNVVFYFNKNDSVPVQDGESTNLTARWDTFPSLTGSSYMDQKFYFDWEVNNGDCGFQTSFSDSNFTIALGLPFEISPCDGVHCEHGGSCLLSGPRTGTCACTNDYFGSRCQDQMFCSEFHGCPVQVSCPEEPLDSPAIVTVTTDLPDSKPFAECDNGHFAFQIDNVGKWALEVFADRNHTWECQFTKKNPQSEVYSVSVYVPLSESIVTIDIPEKIVTCIYDEIGENKSNTQEISASKHPPKQLQQHMAEESTTDIRTCAAGLDNQCLTGKIRQGTVIKVRAELMGNSSSEQGLQVVSCMAKGKAYNFPLIQSGCGDGSFIPKDLGFNTTGKVTVSPPFKAFMVPGSNLLDFDCSFILCSTSCDGSSCESSTKRRKRDVRAEISHGKDRHLVSRIEKYGKDLNTKISNQQRNKQLSKEKLIESDKNNDERHSEGKIPNAYPNEGQNRVNQNTEDRELRILPMYTDHKDKGAINSFAYNPDLYTTNVNTMVLGHIDIEMIAVFLFSSMTFIFMASSIRVLFGMKRSLEKIQEKLDMNIK